MNIEELLAQPGTDRSILSYLIAKDSGKTEEAELLLYAPIADKIMEKLVERVRGMERPERDKLLAALILSIIAQSQGGKTGEALALKAHTTLKELIAEGVPPAKQETKEEEKRASEKVSPRFVIS